MCTMRDFPTDVKEGVGTTNHDKKGSLQGGSLEVPDTFLLTLIRLCSNTKLCNICLDFLTGPFKDPVDLSFDSPDESEDCKILEKRESRTI